MKPLARVWWRALRALVEVRFANLVEVRFANLVEVRFANLVEIASRFGGVWSVDFPRH
jgi:hypothetical protein